MVLLPFKCFASRTPAAAFCTYGMMRFASLCTYVCMIVLRLLHVRPVLFVLLELGSADKLVQI